MARAKNTAPRSGTRKSKEAAKAASKPARNFKVIRPRKLKFVTRA